jgi:hypothetical protein
VLASLKNHPFSVQAFFESSLVLTYALPKADLRHLLPECLEPDVFDDKWGFVAVALVQTKHLRPKGFPEFLGNDFILAGYRIFVRYTTSQGKRLRGLYILGSETNKKKMALLGNIFTHYNYKTIDISIHKSQDLLSVKSERSGLDIRVSVGKAEIPLPANSPFKEWKEARRFAGPLPFTFTYNGATKEVLIIEGVRENWVPQPIGVITNKVGFLEKAEFKNAVLANAFIIENIPYYWKKGRIDKWSGPKENDSKAP